MNTEFAYWVPNLAGGFLTTDYPHEDQWDWEYNKKVIKLAEDAGIKYALSPCRYFSSHSADHSLEAMTIAAALVATTEKIELISAIHTGLWHPGPIANSVITGDHISSGRFHINIIAGWFKEEYTGFGEPWLEHDERYVRTEEFIRVLKGLWDSGRNNEPFNFNGRFYNITDALSKPGPKGNPLIFQAGNSEAAKKVAARVSDVFFLNGNYLSDAKKIISDVKAYAKEFGTKPPRFAINSFLLCEETEQKAKNILEQIIDKAPKQTLEAFKEQVKQAGQSSPEGEGMWADAELHDLVQWNNGFRTGLIGTKEQIVERIRQLDDIGIDIVLMSALNYTQDLPQFGEEILPLIREAEPLNPNKEVAE